MFCLFCLGGAGGGAISEGSEERVYRAISEGSEERVYRTISEGSEVYSLCVNLYWFWTISEGSEETISEGTYGEKFQQKAEGSEMRISRSFLDSCLDSFWGCHFWGHFLIST